MYVRFSRVEEAVVAPVVEETVAAEPIVQEAPAPRTELVKVPLPVVAQTAPEQQEENNADNRDNGGMPRRSRRSPRHLRVSGQRRRRYRDERYPTQSPMPLTVACASPELASGKVWIRYPIVRPQDVQVEEQREQEEVQVQPMVTEVPVAAAVEPAVSAPVVEEVAEVVEAPVQVAEPQPEVVETTHPEVIAAAVTEQPQDRWLNRRKRRQILKKLPKLLRLWLLNLKLLLNLPRQSSPKSQQKLKR